MVLARYLRECGYEVLEAATSEDVLALFGSDRKIDVVLLDAQISGGLAGFTLTVPWAAATLIRLMRLANRN
jgi:CheY-like chemotaxis protein